MNGYRGDGSTRKVYYVANNGETELTPERSWLIQNHSPDGFEWGYTGSGPAQLALALLLDCDEDEIAIKEYQDFKRDIVAKLPQGKNWEIELATIYNWLDDRGNTLK